MQSEVKFPEVKHLDKIIETCHHRLEQLYVCYSNGSMGYGEELKNELIKVLYKIMKKFPEIDVSRVPSDEQKRLDKVYELAQLLHQDLTQEKHVTNTAFNLACNLKTLLKTFI